MKRRRALSTTLAITLGLVALVAGLRLVYPHFLAWRWAQQLETVPDDRAPLLVGRIARLGEPGIPVLVEAIGSPRESVASSGKRAILHEISRWEPRRARSYSPKLAVLARALAERVEEFGPTAQADAADLAERILRRLALDGRVVDNAQVIGWCEHVLRTAAPWGRVPAERQLSGGPQDAQPAAQTRSPGESTVSPPRRPMTTALPEPDAPLRDLAAVPGGGLPVEIVDGPDVGPGRFEGRQLADADPLGSRVGPEDSPPGQSGQPRRLPIEPGSATVLPGHVASSGGGSPHESLPLAPLRLTNEGMGPTGDSNNHGSGADYLAGVDTVELMRRLHATDGQTVVDAQAELTRRGFTRLHLELARRMFAPDPKVRRELARLLPELPGVDPVPWLLQLSRDENAEVRLSAITLMATTGDPALLKALERIAREDPDPRVQDQAARISQRAGSGRY